MTLHNVGLDSLCTLVITQNVGGFGRPSERLSDMPSAISLRMKCLQEELSVQLSNRQVKNSSSLNKAKLHFGMPVGCFN
jgi:DNA-binding transcriptional LysR family regulator